MHHGRNERQIDAGAISLDDALQPGQMIAVVVRADDEGQAVGQGTHLADRLCHPAAAPTVEQDGPPPAPHERAVTLPDVDEGRAQNGEREAVARVVVVR